MTTTTPQRTSHRPGRLRLNLDIDEGLHDRLRVRAATGRTTMTRIVSEALERELADVHRGKTDR